MTRVHRTMTWVVSFPISRPFGDRDAPRRFKRVDKTCFSRARDDEIDTEYKADEPCHKFISEVLGAILSPEICRILRTLAGQGPNRLNFEKQRREELMYRLGCLMELGFCMGPDFRGNKREDKAERYGPEDGPKTSKKFDDLSDADITRQREALEKAIRACHLYAYELRGDAVNLESSKDECGKARDMNKAFSKNKELTGADMVRDAVSCMITRDGIATASFHAGQDVPLPRARETRAPRGEAVIYYEYF